MNERDRTLTTTELAGRQTDDADARLERQQQAGDDGGRSGRPTGEAGREAQAELATMPLLAGEESVDFERRWSEIQTAFVDEPRQSVERADQLVAELMRQLATGFAETRNQLEQQWGRGDEVSTEDLRLALTRYRSFFQRLLAA
jgi:hypothetical protein